MQIFPELISIYFQLQLIFIRINHRFNVRKSQKGMRWFEPPDKQEQASFEVIFFQSLFLIAIWVTTECFKVEGSKNESRQLMSMADQGVSSLGGGDSGGI
jgi:hypothetical protein